MILVPAAVPRTAPVLQRLIDPDRRPGVRAALTVETLPPGLHLAQRPCESVESATVVLSGRLSAAGRVLFPGQLLHHPPGSSHRLTALPGSPAAVLTVRPVPSAAAVPAQRGGTGAYGPVRRIAVDTVRLAAGAEFRPCAEPAADAFLLPLSGAGGLLGGDGGEALLLPGDLVYVRAGERYVLRAGAGGPVTAVLGRIGLLDIALLDAVPGPERDTEPMRSGLGRPQS
ncbi:hypothetical protein ABT247_01765 [Kitasatospora sp. NPDC001539]|uniref:hypothetical protein n=1 Tax=Kitasatospora sp. NPDC001539 TaxID=3154384 RepID=UPI00331AD18A